MSQSGTDPFDQVWMLVQINCVLRTTLEQTPLQDKRIRTSRRKSPEKAVDFLLGVRRTPVWQLPDG